jgi:predicted metal-binding protein
MADSQVTVFICVSCRVDGAPVDKPGRALLEAVTRVASERQASEGRDCAINVKPVECLAVCKRPCTVALTADGKWTYVVGDVDYENHADDVVTAALRYGVSETGIVPWRERPVPFRKGVISRVPPLGFRLEETGL